MPAPAGFPAGPASRKHRKARKLLLASRKPAEKGVPLRTSVNLKSAPPANTMIHHSQFLDKLASADPYAILDAIVLATLVQYVAGRLENFVRKLIHSAIDVPWNRFLRWLFPTTTYTWGSRDFEYKAIAHFLNDTVQPGHPHRARYAHIPRALRDGGKVEIDLSRSFEVRLWCGWRRPWRRPVLRSVAGNQDHGPRFELHAAPVSPEEAAKIFGGSLSKWHPPTFISKYGDSEPIALKSFYAAPEVTEPLWAHLDHFFDKATEARTGVLLYGPPGSGKTTLAQLAAERYRCDVLECDGTNTPYLRGGPPRAIALYDDIDMTLAANKQAVINLMGVLSGPTSGCRVAYFLTTNHIEKLPPALLRVGRIDLKTEVPLMGGDSEAARRIIGDLAGADVRDKIAKAVTARCPKGVPPGLLKYVLSRWPNDEQQFAEGLDRLLVDEAKLYAEWGAGWADEQGPEQGTERDPRRDLEE